MVSITQILVYFIYNNQKKIGGEFWKNRPNCKKADQKQTEKIQKSAKQTKVSIKTDRLSNTGVHTLNTWFPTVRQANPLHASFPPHPKYFNYIFRQLQRILVPSAD